MKACSKWLGVVAVGLAAAFAGGSRAQEAASKAAVGAPAPAFALPDATGKTVKLEDFKGKIVVLEWANPSCPIWNRHWKAKTMTRLAEEWAAKGVVWLAIDSTSKGHGNYAANEEWRKANSLPYPYLLDPEGAVGRTYEAKTTPHMFVIDAKGNLVYEGAIDDDPRGRSGSPRNYVAEALEDLAAGKAVRTAQTKPYGCSVKY